MGAREGQGWGGMRVKAKPENPLVVQWLTLLPMQGAWVPALGTKIPHATQHGQKNF